MVEFLWGLGLGLVAGLMAGRTYIKHRYHGIFEEMKEKLNERIKRK